MKQQVTHLFKHRLVRFMFVGFLNAALHFSVLNTCFYVLDANKIVASFVATICAVTFSFYLNRGFVFKASDSAAIKVAVLFVLVTLSGMLLIHNAIYALFIHLINGQESKIASFLLGITDQNFSKDFIDINLATVFGAIAALVWNYNGYRFFVFPKSNAKKKDDNED